MKALLAILVTSMGCFSASGALAVNTSVSDGADPGVGGHVQLGTFTEVVEDRVVGSLLWNRSLGALGRGSSASTAWGARITTIGRGFVPGFYAMGAYGQDDDLTQQESSTVIAGAGAAFCRMRPGVRGRGYAGLSVGLVFHRQRHETIAQVDTGQFLGLEVTVNAGFDLIGPMFASP